MSVSAAWKCGHGLQDREGTMQMIFFNLSLTSFRGLVFALFTSPKFTLFSMVLDPGRSSLVICNIRII